MQTVIDTRPRWRVLLRSLFTVNNVLMWCGAATGLTGAALLSENNPQWFGYGFLAFLVSNFFWIAASTRTRTWPMIVMNLGYLATSFNGIVSWLTK